jgi:serine/threonine-protein kinase
MTDAAHDSKPPGQFYCPSCEKNFASGETCPDDGTRLVRLKVTDPLLGRVLDGRYTIQEKLGQGGMGAVYRGSQHSVGREVAIKLVTPQLVSDPDVVKRFLREAKLASRLSHPNAVAVMDFGQTEDGMFYLVMELVTGRTLDQIIKAEKKLKPERVVRIGMQVCDALEGAHALQIVHRDLKPANIMLLAQGRDLVKVLDFGLAKSLAPDQTSTTMTNAGALLGTPAFMPPELALGQSCDGRADLYSLGCILYLLGSGRLPFVSDSAHELIAMHGTQPAPPMTGVPPALAEVIDRLLEKEPARRFQSATETREALEAAIDAHRLMTPVAGIARVSAEQSGVSRVSAEQASPLSTSFGVGVPSKTPVPGRPSASSPASGTPVPSAFPTPTGQRPRQSTEIEQLGNSDTLISQGSTPPPAASAASLAPSMMPSSPSRSRVPLIIGAVLLVLAGGATAFFVAKKGATPEQPTAVQQQPEHPSAPPDQPTPVKQPDQPAAGTPNQQQATGSAAPETTKTDVTNVVPEVTKVVPEVTKVVPEITKVVPEVTTKKDNKKTTKTTKTTNKTTGTKTTGTKTTTTKTGDSTKTTGTGTSTGSAAKLPF